VRGVQQRSHEVDALLLRRTEYGDADLILLVFTRQLGKLSVMARAARKSTHRFGGGIEPFHGLVLHISEPAHGELYPLREARLGTMRLSLVQSLRAMDIAGRALSWVRRSLPLATLEPELFVAADELLNRLDQHPPESATVGEALLAEFGLRLLSELGWALQLDRCVRCGKNCPSHSSGTLDPRKGGLVCRDCGGAHYRLGADLRERMLAASRGCVAGLQASEASLVLDIVEETLKVHPGLQDA
jgi:DNA repair protein RecO (recombination protein O)